MATLRVRDAPSPHSACVGEIRSSFAVSIQRPVRLQGRLSAGDDGSQCKQIVQIIRFFFFVKFFVKVRSQQQPFNKTIFNCFGAIAVEKKEAKFHFKGKYQSET